MLIHENLTREIKTILTQYQQPWKQSLFAPPATLQAVYYNLIQSHFDNCRVLWGSSPIGYQAQSLLLKVITVSSSLPDNPGVRLQILDHISRSPD